MQDTHTHTHNYTHTIINTTHTHARHTYHCRQGIGQSKVKAAVNEELEEVKYKSPVVGWLAASTGGAVTNTTITSKYIRTGSICRLYHFAKI